MYRVAKIVEVQGVETRLCSSIAFSVNGFEFGDSDFIIDVINMSNGKSLRVSPHELYELAMGDEIVFCPKIDNCDVIVCPTVSERAAYWHDSIRLYGFDRELSVKEWISKVIFSEIDLYGSSLNYDYSVAAHNMGSKSDDDLCPLGVHCNADESNVYPTMLDMYYRFGRQEFSFSDNYIFCRGSYNLGKSYSVGMFIYEIDRKFLLELM